MTSVPDPLQDVPSLVSDDTQEALPLRTSSDHVLVFTSDRALSDGALSASGSSESAEWVRLGESLPGVEIALVQDESEFRRLLDGDEFQIVVFDHPVEVVTSRLYLPELRLRNSTPGVLVVALPEDPIAVASLYNAGCHRLVPKLPGWHSELAQGIRSLLRAKRTERAHDRMGERLTEMLGLLEEKNKRLDEFSMTLAHDIRGPLAGISMKLEYLLDVFPKEMPPRATQLMARALDSSKRLTSIVQSMYEYARLGAKAAKFEPVDLGTLVRETLSDLPLDTKMDVKVGVDTLPTVWGCPDLLRRIFINLVNNSVKYSDKPSLVINIGCERVEERALGRYADIFVADNGPGIPQEEVAGLFAMFARGSTARGDNEGLGAGLAVVQRIVELHLGKIHVKSEVGHGVRFILSLPTEPIDLS
jgi:signal transduction histidine kinase